MVTVAGQRAANVSAERMDRIQPARPAGCAAARRSAPRRLFSSGAVSFVVGDVSWPVSALPASKMTAAQTGRKENARGHQAHQKSSHSCSNVRGPTPGIPVPVHGAGSRNGHNSRQWGSTIVSSDRSVIRPR